jgi:hypothetical protein
MPVAGEVRYRLDVVVSQRARRTVRLILASTIASLVALGTAGEIARLGFQRDTLLGFVRLFGLGQEANVPTWYASATLLIAAVLAGAVALHESQRGSQLGRQWWLLVTLLTLMSLDETAVIHETASVLLARRLLGTEGLPWYVFYAWIVPGTVLLAGILWWFSTLWRNLSAPIRRQFTVAAALYFGGALGLEVAEAAWAARFGMQNAIYSALWTTQELLEMIGVAALILALLDHLALSRASITLRFGDAGRGD